MELMFPFTGIIIYENLFQDLSLNEDYGKTGP